MSRSYVIRPAARADIDLAYDWYEQQAAGRGDTFLLELRDRIADICAAPESFGRVAGNVRAARLPRSQYIVYFRVEPAGVAILAVQHARAHPSRWKRRR